MTRTVTLLDESREDTSRLHLSALLEPDGELRIEGQDLGPITAPISPDGEYEYFYTVRPNDVPALITALGGRPGDDILTVLRERWSGRDSYGLDQAIRDSGVPYSFFAYP